MESYVRIGGRGLKNLTYPYMGVGGMKNFQNHPYVINEWPLTACEVYEKDMERRARHSSSCGGLYLVTWRRALVWRQTCVGPDSSLLFIHHKLIFILYSLFTNKYPAGAAQEFRIFARFPQAFKINTIP